MRLSTDAILVFGVPVGGGKDHGSMPWSGLHDDTDDWLLELSGWKPPHPGLYTEAGEYAPGVTDGDPRLRENMDHRREWKKAHPYPVALVSHCCSDESPMWILAVPGFVIRAHRGHPVDVPKLVEPDPAQVAAIVDFARLHFPDKANEAPRWMLCSDWY